MKPDDVENSRETLVSTLIQEEYWMLNFMELVNLRQSVRQYADRPVEREKIQRCLEAARLAPSACNSQPWKFIVVDDPELTKAVALKTFGKVVSFNHFTLQVPVFILIISEPPNVTAKFGAIVKNRPLHLIDIGIAAIQFCLQAVQEGLGTCMLGWFDEKPIKQLLHIPPTKRLDLIITLGYPESNEIRSKTRKTLDQIASYNKY
jgi:nitroreductase